MTPHVLLTPDAVEPLLRGRFGRPYLWSESCTSTQNVLRGSVLPEGAVAVTEHQTSGRGREGRPWHDVAGKSLLVSLLLRPPAGTPTQQLALVAGLAVAESVEQDRDAAGIKWPNDVLLEGRKVAGVLLEASEGAVVCGIGVNVAQVEGELPADYAKQQSWARADRLGVTGFCGGGALTLHTAAEYPGVTAAVPWYGHVKRTYSDAPGVDAFSLASKIKAPVLGLYGEADTGIPSEDVKRFEAELKKTNPDVEFVLYPGAPHGFFSDDRPQVYKKEAAEDAWKRCLAFFDKHLKA